MLQDQVAIICSNQARGAGTMIGGWPPRILASCPEPKEDYITGVINLQKVRQARQHSRNLQQRRPELYGELVKPVSYDIFTAAPLLEASDEGEEGEPTR